VVTGFGFTCTRHVGGSVRCWGSGSAGYNFYGQLGYGHTNNIGDNEHPVSAGPVPY